MSPEEFIDWLESHFSVGEIRVYNYNKRFEKKAAEILYEGYIPVQLPGGVVSGNNIGTFMLNGVSLHPNVNMISSIQLWWKFGYDYRSEFNKYLEAYTKAIINLVNGSLLNLEPKKIQSILKVAYKGVYRTTIAKFMRANISQSS